MATKKKRKKASGAKPRQTGSGGQPDPSGPSTMVDLRSKAQRDCLAAAVRAKRKRQDPTKHLTQRQISNEMPGRTAERVSQTHLYALVKSGCIQEIKAMRVVGYEVTQLGEETLEKLRQLGWVED